MDIPPKTAATFLAEKQALLGVSWEEVYAKANADICKDKPYGDPGYWAEVYSYAGWHDPLVPLVAVLKEMLGAQNQAVLDLYESGDIYLFGVAQGESMQYTHNHWPGHRLFGFDSFKGLPKEDAKVTSAANWHEGSYSAATTLEKIVKESGGPEWAHVFPGFFNDTLVPGFVEKEGLRPAFYVDVDSDLYVSTYPVLDYLFSNRIIRVGTLIGYDDWWTVACRKFHSPFEDTCFISPLSNGEGLAHSHITARWGVRFRCVAGPCKPLASPFTYGTQCHLHNTFGPVFIVEAIGDFASPSTGFEFSSEQQIDFLRRFTFCNTC
jgi:hypothetical protein